MSRFFYFLRQSFLLRTPVVLAFVLAFVVPLNVYMNNRHEIAGYTPEIVIQLLLGIAVFLTGILVLLHLVLALILPRRTLGTLWVAVTAFCIVTGMLLPLTTTAGQLEISEIGLNTTNLAMAVFAAVVIAALSLTSFIVPLATAVVLFVAGNTALATTSLLTSSETPFSRITGLSSGKNILVVSFDGLSRDVALDVLRQNAELRSRLKDFTLFTNAISNAPSTTVSLAYETLGGRDLKAEFDTEDRLVRSLDRSTSSLSYLIDHGFDVATYGHYRLASGQPDREVLNLETRKYTFAENLPAADLLLTYGAARTLSAFLAVHPALASLWETYAPFRSTDEELIRRLRNHRGASWDTMNITDVRDFDAYASQIHIKTAQPVAIFMHLLFTHYPVDFDANCEYQSDDVEWHKSHQNKAGIEAETVCALGKFADLLDRLRAIGAYDQSLIVLKSDHGAPAFVYDPDKMESFSIRSAKLWGYSRHTPLLAIKAIKATHDASPIDPRHVALSDLATTLCKAATPEATCERFRGFDLLDKAALPEDATYLVTTTASPDSGFAIDTHATIEFPRKPEFVSALHNRLMSELLVTPVACGQSLDLRKGYAFNNGLTNDGKWVFWRDGADLTVRWSKPTCETNAARLTLTIRDGRKPPTLKDARFEGPIDGAYTTTVALEPGQQQITLADGDDPATFVSLELVAQPDPVKGSP